MDKSDVEEWAKKSGMTPREYCLSQIEKYESLLSVFSEDYRAMSQEEFQQRIEEEAP